MAFFGRILSSLDPKVRLKTHVLLSFAGAETLAPREDEAEGGCHGATGQAGTHLDDLQGHVQASGWAHI